MPTIERPSVSLEDSFRYRLSRSIEPLGRPISMLLPLMHKPKGVNLVGTGGLEPPTSTASR